METILYLGLSTYLKTIPLGADMILVRLETTRGKHRNEFGRQDVTLGRTGIKNQLTHYILALSQC